MNWGLCGSLGLWVGAGERVAVFFIIGAVILRVFNKVGIF